MHIFLTSPAIINRYVPPILWLTMAFIAGVQSAFLLTLFQISIIASLAICSTTLIYSLGYRKITGAIPFLLLFSFGFARSISIKSAHDNLLEQISGKELCYRVFIHDIVPLNDHKFHYLITMHAIEARNHQEKVDLNGSIICYCKHKPDFEIGDILEIPKLKIKKGSSESYNDYCIKEGILGTACFYKPLELSNKESSNSITAWINKMRIGMFDQMRSKMSRTAFSFFSSFFLGNRTSDKKENDILKQDCKLWGISHYLARSGLHLVVFILIWQYLLRFIPLSFIIKQLILLLLIFIYYLFSWNSISFIRALMTFIFYKSYELTNTLSHTIHIITLATLATLAYNPFYLFFLDFQLSYSITFFLALIRHLHTIELRRATQNH